MLGGDGIFIGRQYTTAAVERSHGKHEKSRKLKGVVILALRKITTTYEKCEKIIAQFQMKICLPFSINNGRALRLSMLKKCENHP